MKLEPCPWCKELPRYRQQTRWCNYDDDGMSYINIIELPAEHIECSNVKCQVRPNLTRINTNDAIKVWNMVGNEK